MHKFVVKQAIKTADNELLGHELLFDIEKDKGGQSSDYNAADAISSFLTQNSSKIDRSALNFMTFTPNLLFKDMPKMFKADELVIQIEDSVIVYPLAQKMVQEYREQGYHIAINDFQFQPRYLSFMEYTDYIKINVKNTEKPTVETMICMAKGFHKLCIATNIDTEEDYTFAKTFNFDYYEGSYIAKAAIVKTNKLQYMESNFCQLLVAITSELPDVDEIHWIIKRDASLTYELLRVVNSVHFALRHPTSSIRQAIMVLGLEQLKKWVYLLSFNRKEQSGSEDMLKISFLRATFSSSLMDYCEDMPISKADAYLMGMLSALPLMVDATMEELLEDISTQDTIKEALITHEGRCGTLCKLVLCYESAQWDKIKEYAEELGIPTESMAQIYMDCEEEVNLIWQELTQSHFGESEKEALEKL